MPAIELTTAPDVSADAVITAGLMAHLEPRWGDRGSEPVSAYLRDDGGALIGGLIGGVAWRWLYIQRLWVDAAHRSHGHGAALLAAAEEFARSRGCCGVHLDTFGEERLPFYEKAGYSVWGTLEGFPPGGRHHHLRKLLPNE